MFFASSSCLFSSRVNEQPALIVVHTLFMREHNRFGNNKLNKTKACQVFFKSNCIDESHQRIVEVEQKQSISSFFFQPSCIDESHHRIVGQLSRLHRDWSGEKLYQVSSLTNSRPSETLFSKSPSEFSSEN